MARSRVAIGLSFIDVLCCAMGGAVVLAVVFSTIKNPVLVPLSDEFILIEMVVNTPADEERSGVWIPGPGLRVIPPLGEAAVIDLTTGKSTDGILVDEALGGVGIWEARVKSEADGGSTVVYAIVRQPIAGKWEFRPTMTRWPRADFGWENRFQREAMPAERLGGTLEVLPESIRVWTRDGERVLEGMNKVSISTPGSSNGRFIIELGAVR